MFSECVKSSIYTSVLNLQRNTRRFLYTDIETEAKAPQMVKARARIET